MKHQALLNIQHVCMHLSSRNTHEIPMADLISNRSLRLREEEFTAVFQDQAVVSLCKELVQ